MDKYSEKNIATLHPNIRKFVSDLYEPYGDRIRITCGFRSNEEQEILKKNHKSNAGANESFHNFGLAFDFCVLLAGGQVDYNFKKYPYVQEFIDLFKENGFAYSGDWSHAGFWEEGHLQYDTYSLAQLQNKQKDSAGYPIL